MMIGEQPADHKDNEGRPFVGAEGKLLDKCLAK
jgi:uracil-DNA glycosylase family 4